MKVIFLDIDGVLVTHASWRIRDHGHASAATECVAALNRITDATQAVIVVSSTWRIGTSICELRDIINGHFGVTGKVIAKTRKITTKRMFEGKLGEVEVSAERGDEIDYWLREDHPWPIESFVILDDENDMGRHLHRLVHTNFDDGLTMADAERAISMLIRKSVAA